jgi:hypothetical protein
MQADPCLHLPGSFVRWRHARRAAALGFFQEYGPGPFEVVTVNQPEVGLPPVSFVVRTEAGLKEIAAEWLESSEGMKDEG